MGYLVGKDFVIPMGFQFGIDFKYWRFLLDRDNTFWCLHFGPFFLIYHYKTRKIFVNGPHCALCPLPEGEPCIKVCSKARKLKKFQISV